MGIIDTARKQTAIWWQRTGIDGFGVPSFAAPVDIRVRWDDSAEKFITAEGEEKVSRSVVMVDVADGVGLDDYLKLGASDSGTASNPENETGAYPVLRYDLTPNLANTETLAEAYL